MTEELIGVTKEQFALELKLELAEFRSTLHMELAVQTRRFIGALLATIVAMVAIFRVT